MLLSETIFSVFSKLKSLPNLEIAVWATVRMEKLAWLHSVGRKFITAYFSHGTSSMATPTTIICQNVMVS